ncbi:MAG TPA: energy transducer TonB [Chitinophagaceae bacterium]|nr:energy transducer TonB [Chitinophagaceae bacterium]
MLKLIFSFFLLLSAYAGLAQTDTIYVYNDKDWRPTTRQQAYFYGKIFKEGNSWRRFDYWVKTNIMQMDGYYKDSATSIKNGPANYYTETGYLDDSSNYVENERSSAYYFYPNHKLKAYIIFDTTGEPLEQKGYDDNGKEMPGFIVQQGGLFKGGIVQWQKYIKYHLLNHPPKRWQNGEIWGSVDVSFAIEKDGSIDQVEVSRSSGYKELDDNAVEIISGSPKWKPAIRFNVPVVYYQKQQISYARAETD